MAEIFDLNEHRQKKEEENLEKIKQELEIELRKLDFNINDQLNNYVIFDTTSYYSLEENITLEMATDVLMTAGAMLEQLGEKDAVIDIENVVTRLKNKSY